MRKYTEIEIKQLIAASDSESWNREYKPGFMWPNKGGPVWTKGLYTFNKIGE